MKTHVEIEPPSARVLGEDRVPCQWAWIHLHPKSKTRVSVVVVVIATQLILTRLSQRLQSRPLKESLGGISISPVSLSVSKTLCSPLPRLLCQGPASSDFPSSAGSHSFFDLPCLVVFEDGCCGKGAGRRAKLSLSLPLSIPEDVWSGRQCSSRWPHVTLHWGLMMGGRARPGHDGIVARSAVPTSALRVSTKSLKKSFQAPLSPCSSLPVLQREAISLGKYSLP